jgi:hypothetical protein
MYGCACKMSMIGIHFFFIYGIAMRAHIILQTKNGIQPLYQVFSSNAQFLVSQLLMFKCDTWNTFFTFILSKLPKASFGRNIRYDLIQKLIAQHDRFNFTKSEKIELSTLLSLFTGQERLSVLKLLLPIWDSTKIDQSSIICNSAPSYTKQVFEIFENYNKNCKVQNQKPLLPWVQFTDSKTDSEDNQCIVCTENQKCIALECGHVDMCLSCCEKQWKNEQVTCIKCRQVSKNVKRVFL